MKTLQYCGFFYQAKKIIDKREPGKAVSETHTSTIIAINKYLFHSADTTVHFVPCHIVALVHNMIV